VLDKPEARKRERRKRAGCEGRKSVGGVHGQKRIGKIARKGGKRGGKKDRWSITKGRAERGEKAARKEKKDAGARKKKRNRRPAASRIKKKWPIEGIRGRAHWKAVKKRKPGRGKCKGWGTKKATRGGGRVKKKKDRSRKAMLAKGQSPIKGRKTSLEKAGGDRQREGCFKAPISLCRTGGKGKGDPKRQERGCTFTPSKTVGGRETQKKKKKKTNAQTFVVGGSERGGPIKGDGTSMVRGGNAPSHRSRLLKKRKGEDIRETTNYRDRQGIPET